MTPTIAAITPPPPATVPAPTFGRRGRPRSADASRPYVEAVKASKGTWAFRLRWKYSASDRPIIYVDRVSDEVYELIQKEYLSEYKQAIIRNYKGTIPTRKPAARDRLSSD